MFVVKKANILKSFRSILERKMAQGSYDETGNLQRHSCESDLCKMSKMYVKNLCKNNHTKANVTKHLCRYE